MCNFRESLRRPPSRATGGSGMDHGGARELGEPSRPRFAELEIGGIGGDSGRAQEPAPAHAIVLLVVPLRTGCSRTRVSDQSLRLESFERMRAFRSAAVEVDRDGG